MLRMFWDGVMLYWLLEDAEERQELLQLEEKAPSQVKRLQPALQARNLRMAGPGRNVGTMLANLCCWIQTLPDGTKSEH